MNTNKIKQIFQTLTKKAAESLDSDIPGQRIPGGRIRSLPVIRGGMTLTERASEAYIEALDEITAIAEIDGTWSKSTVDDVLWEHVENVLQVSPEERAVAIRSQGNEVVRRFSKTPSQWTVDLLVYGLHVSCADLKFGRLTFFSDEVSVDNEDRSDLAEFPTGNQMFARLETTAIDEQSAVHRAGSIIDEHVMILNALCSRGNPSPIRVSRVNHMDRTYAVHRVGKSVNSMGTMGFQGINTKFPMMRNEVEYVLKEGGGGRISAMLSSPENEFTKRVLSAYALAGAACVDAHPERRFLMFAIALESAVLGKDTKSELAHQLSNRVAHLIGNGLSGRKHVVRWVNNLYDRRSKIVHMGEYGVSQTESGLVQLYCMAALATLVLSTAFTGFTTNAQLEDWFKDRMLEGPVSHVRQEPQQIAVPE